MDKSTNSINIAISVVNFLNAIFLFIFTNVIDVPLLVVGVVGVVLFVLNAVMSLVLILMVIVSTVFSLIRKNPDARYQFMSDDRASFMKSQSQLNATTELDALAATARGDKLGYKSGFDNESLESSDIRKNNEASASYSISATESQNSFYPGAQPNAPIPLTQPSAELAHCERAWYRIHKLLAFLWRNSEPTLLVQQAGIGRSIMLGKPLL